jgi:hypothetical protein
MMLVPDHRASFEAFTANCRLVPIMTVRSASQPSAYLSRLSKLDSIRAELDELEGSLPWAIRRFAPSDRGSLLPTGVRE